jgi:peptide/nickel transport system substrate-binding protein
MMRNSSIHFTLLLCFVAGLLFTDCKSEPKQNENWKRKGNDVIIRIDAEPDGLNPLLSTTIYATQINNQLFSFLLFIDPTTLQLIPQLAKSAPQVKEITSGPYAGGVAYTFDLHDEAVWDDGKPVTGHDFVFTVKAVLNPKVNAQRYRPFFAFIKDIQVDASNPKRFTVFTNEKYILGEEAIASTVQVLPAHLYDPQNLLEDIDIKDFTDPEKIAQLAESDARLQQFADLAQSPKFSREVGAISGCGPYRLETWEPQQKVELVKKENWWGDDLADKFPALGAYPDKLTFKVIGDAATALASLKAEEIDVVADIDPKDFTDIKQDQLVNEAYNLYTPASLTSFFIYVNTRNPKLNDKLVRQALAHAVNVDEVINTLYFGLAEPLSGPVLPTKDYANKNLKPIAYNPEKAKELLKQAGWIDSNNNGTVDKTIDGELTELSLSYLITPNREISRNIALVLQENARKAGINIEPVTKEFTQIIADLRKGEYELSSGGRTVSPTLWDPMQSWHTQGDNRTGFGNAETDKLIEDLRITLDKGKRDEMYKKLQAAIYDEVPEVYLYVPSGRLAAHQRFEVIPTAMHPGFFPNLFRLKYNE